MPLKPNYRHERTQKARTRELRRQEKQQRREEISAKRKSALIDDSSRNTDGEDVPHDHDPRKSAPK